MVNTKKMLQVSVGSADSILDCVAVTRTRQGA